MEADKLIVSQHHEWMWRLPLKDNVLVCIDCGIDRPMHTPTRLRCRPKLERAGHGYRGWALNRWLASKPAPPLLFFAKEMPNGS